MGYKEMSTGKYEPYYFMCMAYLEIGEVCIERKTNYTGEYQNAVAYQLYHALELFVKYAILRKTGNAKKTHDFSELFREYYSLYPDDEYHIEHPFEFTSYEPCELNLGEREMYENHIAQFEPKILDQHLRYPPDHRTGGYSYKIDHDYFNAIKGRLATIHRKLNC